MNGVSRPRKAFEMSLPEPVPPSRLAHEEHAEEQGRAVQRYLTLTSDLARITEDRDNWRRQCVLAEERVAALEMREAELRARLEERTVELGRERDQYRVRLVRLVAQFEAAGHIVLQAMEQAKAQVPDADLKALAALAGQEASRADGEVKKQTEAHHESDDGDGSAASA